jgi:hypothetical protein
VNAFLNLALGQALQQRFGLFAEIAVIEDAAHLTYVQVNIGIILTHLQKKEYLDNACSNCTNCTTPIAPIAPIARI